MRDKFTLDGSSLDADPRAFKADACKPITQTEQAELDKIQNAYMRKQRVRRVIAIMLVVTATAGIAYVFGAWWGMPVAVLWLSFCALIVAGHLANSDGAE